MPALAKPLWQPLGAFLARAIVRLWPDETKQWGLAFEAELGEITTPLASFRWVIGGILLLTRERVKSFFKSFRRPVGVPAGSPLESLVRNSSRVPRTPRILTALLFLASAAILLHPDVRSCLRSSLRGISSGSDELNNPNWQPSRWDSVRRLRKEAQTNRDPRLLALLSLLSTDNDERLRMSDEAIRKDRSLTWLDYEQFTNQDHAFVLPVSRLERLQKWDPNNGALRELAARAAAYRSGAEWGVVRWPQSSYVQKGGLIQVGESPAPDAQWLSAMDEVFTATKYDTYLTDEFELIRDVTQKYGIRDPDVSLYVLASHHIPNLLSLRSYNNWLLNESERKEQAGDRVAALADARKALRFAQRMWLGQKSTIELLIANTLGIQACKRLQAALEEQGNSEEASLVAYELASWKTEIDRVRFANQSSARAGQWVAEWAGMTILLATVLILLTSLASCFSVLVLWLKSTSVEARGRLLVFSSWALDAAPLILLGACSAVYLAYQPFGQTYSAYFSAERHASNFEGLFEARFLTQALPYSAPRIATSVLFWTVTTVALSLLAGFLLVRMFVRELRRA